MARLTILQASQQGFGSTLTIHRHIKDGSLPMYEEGDVKLLEVDDLIALFGEPGAPTNDNQSISDPAEIDIYEYNRMKSELDQITKKNLWLAADLAEVGREIKEKEATFHAERARLLKILEQAQALLLREAKRAGAGLKKNDISGLNLNQAPEQASPEQQQPPVNGDAIAPDSGSMPPGEMSVEEILAQRNGDSERPPTPEDLFRSPEIAPADQPEEAIGFGEEKPQSL